MSEPSIKNVHTPRYECKVDFEKRLTENFRFFNSVDKENAKDVEHAATEIANTADFLLDAFSDSCTMMDVATSLYNEALDSIDSLLQFCPHYILIDKHKLPLADALAWVRENAEGDYQSFKMNNLYGIVFTDEADLTLFKVKFL